MIPTYSEEWPGRRLRDYSETAILNLELLGSVAVRRDPKGRIKSARFLPVVRRLPEACRADGLSRVRYTTLETVGHRRVLCHKPLPYRVLDEALSPEEREAVMRAAYSAVELSVMYGPRSEN